MNGSTFLGIPKTLEFKREGVLGPDMSSMFFECGLLV